MSEEEGNNRGTAVDPPQYGTFQGVANYPPPRPPRHPHLHPPPAIGLPRPVPPPDHYGYQTVTGYAVAEGTPIRESRLPCCGIGLGWFLFIIGFFLAAIPWYFGAVILTCSRIDYREKPGHIACTIAAILATFAGIISATRGSDDW